MIFFQCGRFPFKSGFSVDEHSTSKDGPQTPKKVAPQTAKGKNQSKSKETLHKKDSNKSQFLGNDLATSYVNINFKEIETKLMHFEARRQSQNEDSRDIEEISVTVVDIANNEPVERYEQKEKVLQKQNVSIERESDKQR